MYVEQGATFVMSLAIDDSVDVSLGCADIGRADGLAEAYCGRVHCPDFGPGASTPTRGMCDASCGYCGGSGGGGGGSPIVGGLYASVTVFPEHAVGGSGAAGKTVWPSASVALGDWEFNPRTAGQTKQCLGDWFCYFPGSSNFTSSGQFRWVASGTGRFTIVVRPNCDIPAAAYPAGQRAQHVLVCRTSWRLSVNTPMMVSTEYDIGQTATNGATAQIQIATAVGFSPDRVDVLSNVLAHRAIVHIHTDDLLEAESVRTSLIQLLRGQLLGQTGTSSHKVCIVPERHIVVRTIEVRDQDPCVMDVHSECHAQMVQMFQRRVLPVMAFATSFQALTPLPGSTPGVTDGAIPVAVNVGLRALTVEAAAATLGEIERRAGVVRVDGVVELGPGHRRRLQSAVRPIDDDDDNVLWCSDRAAAINTACCTSDGACSGGVPSSCDFVCALAFIPYWQACDHFLMNDAATALAMLGLYAQCEMAATGDGICERIDVRTPPLMAEIASGHELAVALTISAPDNGGSTTLELTVGVEQVTLETTVQPCVLAEYSECAAQAAAMFAVDSPGWGSQALALEPLGPIIGGSVGGLVTVRATLVIAAVSDAHADEIIATFQ